MNLNFIIMKMSSIKKSLLAVIFVKTSHQKVLAFFLAHPSGRFYGTEIASKTGISTGQASNVLGDFRKAGLVEMERRGKTELYRIISDNKRKGLQPPSGRLRAFKDAPPVHEAGERDDCFPFYIMLKGLHRHGCPQMSSDVWWIL